MKIANSEVLVVNFHRFPKGFDTHPEAHGLLVDYLRKYPFQYSNTIMNIHTIPNEIELSYLWARKANDK